MTNKKPTREDETERSLDLRLIGLTAIFAAYVCICGLVYFFHFRDEVDKWLRGTNRPSTTGPQSSDMQHEVKTIHVNEFFR